MKLDKKYIKIIICIIIIILLLVGTFTNLWTVISTPKNIGESMDFKFTIGLFKFCRISSKDNECQNISDIKGDPEVSKNVLTTIKNIKIFLFAGIVLILLSIIILLFIPKQREYFILTLGLGGILSIIGVSIWSTNKNLNGKFFKDSIPEINVGFGYSYYLQLFAGIIAILYTICNQFFLKY
jgi:uncharacterized membrane protein YqjE